MAASQALTTTQQISFSELKVIALTWWQEFASTMQVVPNLDDAKAEIRAKFGDLRRRRTWELAYSYYLIQDWSNTYAYEGYWVFTQLMNPEQCTDWEAALFEDCLNFLLEHPGGLHMIRTGLEQLLKYNDPDTWAASQPFLELIRKRQGPATEVLDRTLQHHHHTRSQSAPSMRSALPFSTPA